MEDIELSEKQIRTLLESGWVHVTYSDPYFKSAFIDHIGTHDRIKYGDGWFVKKSENLYKKLVALGMDKSSGTYDSCIMMWFGKMENHVSITLYSLSEGGNMDEIAKAIRKKRTKNE